MKYALVCPCYNENEAVVRFLHDLEAVLRTRPETFEVVIVDDASTDDTPARLAAFRFQAPNLRLRVLSLAFNLGQQAAIYQGLLYARGGPAERFIIMDSDGEDSPRALPGLLDQGDYAVVHVARGKRREGLAFRLAYWAYRLLFRLITGRRINFGNYCRISRPVLEQAVQTSFVHFPAYIHKLKVSRAYLRADRDPRHSGRSKMGYHGLIYHAFKSLIEYAEQLLMLFLKLFGVTSLFLLATLGYVLYHKLFTGRAIAGWASTVGIGLLNTALIAIGFFVIGLLLLNIGNQRQHHLRTPLWRPLDEPDEAP